MAPELLSSDSPQTRYSSAIDMYAVGILINALWSQEKPYKNANMGALTLIQEVAEGFRPTIREDCPPGFRELAETCWAAEPAQRLSANQLLERLSLMQEEGLSSVPVEASETYGGDADFSSDFSTTATDATSHTQSGYVLGEETYTRDSEV